MAILNGKKLDAKNKGLLDLYYDKNLVDRIAVLESIKTEPFAFTGITDRIALPYAAREGRTPFVVVGGLLQTYGSAFTMPDSQTIEFVEPLLGDEDVLVILTYEETT